MSVIGSAIGAGMGAFGSIFGGLSASKAIKRIKRNLKAQRHKNREWYDRRYNEDATQRADAQAILSRTQEAIRSRNRDASGAQAVTGGTEESVAAAKAANNRAIADAATTIAVNGEARKDAIESQYQQRDDQFQQQLDNLEAQRAQAVSQAIQGVGQAGANIAGIL